MAATVAVTVASDVAVAQTTVEQRIQVTGDPGGPIQLPGMMGGQRQFKTGTGRIRGRVLASEGGGPIRRAQVRISGPEVAPKASLTDAEGRFEFRDLPAGRFTLQATKSGYVSVQYGQTRPFESGKPIELADKQSVDNADIGMPRGSVISGRVVDEYGDPIPDVSVTAMRQSWQGGRRRLVPSPGRIAPDKRSRTVPHLRPAAGRVLRQRVAAQRRPRAPRHAGHGFRRHRDDHQRPERLGAEVRLRLDLLPGHGQRRRGAAHLARAQVRNRRAPTSRSCRFDLLASPASSSAPMASRSRAHRFRRFPSIAS